MDDQVTPRDLPERIGPYRIIDWLGQGGMGVVYKAQAQDGRLVALKVMRPELALDQASRDRFDREAQAAQQVPRFCTAELLAWNLDGPTAYIATEYIEGRTLREDVAERGPRRDGKLEALAMGMAVALVQIHSAGVMHKDLSPSNVMISVDGPKVIDFGLARLVDGLTPSSHSGAGTPGYLAPEQARRSHLTPACDIFAWGAVVTFAATEHNPFGEGPLEAILYRVVNEEPDLGTLGAPLRPIVEKALAKDPRERPTAEKLVEQLSQALHVAPGGAHVFIHDSWTGNELRRPRRPVSLLLTVAAVLVVLFGAAIYYVNSHGSNANRPPDGADPKLAKCDLDAKDTTTAMVTGQSNSKQVYGQLTLRYSPHCQAAWPQYITSSLVPTGARIHLKTRRPASNANTAFDFSYTLAPQVYTIFGNVLQTGRGCVSVDVDVRDSGNNTSLATGHTPCLTPT